jgi:protein SCO1/2
MNDLSVAKPPAGLQRLTAVFLAALLSAVIAIPVAVLWRAFSPQIALAPDFTLIDQGGRPFTLSKLRGRPVVLFFGYTHCPDECPTTFARLAKAVRASGVPSDVRVAFITVDPERDFPATLKRYVRLFDPGFIGLTGSLRTLSPVYAAYHTARQIDQVDHERHDYSVTHGTTIYYVGRDGSIKGLGQWDDAVAEIVRDLHSFQ